MTARGRGHFLGLEDIFDDLWSTLPGKIFLCNLLDSRALGTLDARVAREFAREWQSRAIAQPSVPKFDLVEQTVSNNRLFLRSRVKPGTLPGHISTVFPASHLARRIEGISTDLGILASLIDDVGTLSDRVALENALGKIYDVIDTLSGHKDGLIRFRLPGGSLYKGNRDFGWFSSYDDNGLESGCWTDRTRWAERADLTRDILGLVHFGSSWRVPLTWEPVLLAVYVVPSSAIPAGTAYGRPNALDAGKGRRYRACFGKKTGMTDEWGRTINLDRFMGARPHRGGREIIVADFVPSDAIRFGILGIAMVPRGDFEGVHDDAFANLLMGKRSIDASRRTFASLV